MTNHAGAEAALSAFGITEARLQLLTGGTINDVFRVDSAQGIFALKQYSMVVQRSLEIERVSHAQEVARTCGLPVPRVISATDGRGSVAVNGLAFTLNEFVHGRTFAVDAMPVNAARRMGVMLAKIQAALAELPPEQVLDLLSLDQIRVHLEELLGLAEARRHHDPVDERAYLLIRQKLALLETLDSVPTYERGWTHGDYQRTNVLFNDRDEVAGIIDFDALSYFSPARDAMRCIILSFPSLRPNAFAFFEGYASAKGLSPDEARGYVDFYRYISTYRVWPASTRYLDPDGYNPRWDALIEPEPEWDWAMLSEQFAEIATRVAAGADVRL
jgi:Ser/Thr protein kinase RdoA (MazF antagonist)